MPYVINNNPNPQDELLKALLSMVAPAVLSSGFLSPKNIPNPGFGQTGTPGTTFSRAGAPSNPLAPPQNPQQSMGGFRPSTPGSPYADQPMLNALQFKTLSNMQDYKQGTADLAYKKAQTNSLTPEFQAELIRRAQGLTNTNPQQSTTYSVGDLIQRGGKWWQVTGFDKDGTPLVEEH